MEGRSSSTSPRRSREAPSALRTRERILKGGLLIIGLLFVTVMFNDISRNMGGIMRLIGRLFGSA